MVKTNHKMKAARAALGYTQLDLARAVDVTETAISRIETGRMLPDEHLRNRIAEALNIKSWEIC